MAFDHKGCQCFLKSCIFIINIFYALHETKEVKIIMFPQSCMHSWGSCTETMEEKFTYSIFFRVACIHGKIGHLYSILCSKDRRLNILRVSQVYRNYQSLHDLHNSFPNASSCSQYHTSELHPRLKTLVEQKYGNKINTSSAPYRKHKGESSGRLKN